MTDHVHSWVNTATGVTCTSCSERIDAPECPHEYKFDRIEDAEPTSSFRKAVLVCALCGQEQAKLTNRTDDEIAAEVAKAHG